MVKEIVKDVFFLGQKSEPATRADLQIGIDLQDTLWAHRAHCVGMAANMIGVKKNIIIVSMGMKDVVMFNPVIKKMNSPYETEGTIVHREWEDVYLKSVDNYPTLIEYAEAVSVGITYESEITDEFIEACLISANEEACWKLKSILYMMQLKGDVRLKQTAIEYIERIHGRELVIYAYRMLNKIKNDSEIEQLFIDYLAECDDIHDMIRIIVNSYWDE